mgnify:CR=1 FL=1
MTRSVTEYLVIGEALIDIVARHAETPVEHVGGSPANVAVGLARLDNKVTFATCLGEDARGERIRRHLTRHSIQVVDDEGEDPTSTAVANIDQSGAATYEFDIRWAPGPVKIGPEVGHLHTGSIAAVLDPGAADVATALEAGREQATTSYDPNFRPSIMGNTAAAIARIESIIPLADVVKASSDDLATMYPDDSVEDVLARWCDLGPALVVITKAEHGVSFRVRSTGEVRELPAPATTVVDTVGAGDSFMAGLISGLASAGLLGGPEARMQLQQANADAITPAIERGGRCGAMTVARAGAYAPSLDEL